jgi:hypothetical protein
MQWRQALRDAESDVESAALLSKLEAGLSCEDLTEPEQIPQLNALELFRLGHLPADHPAHAAVEAAHEAGWRWPVREPASFPVGDGVLDRERAGW